MAKSGLQKKKHRAKTQAPQRRRHHQKTNVPTKDKLIAKNWSSRATHTQNYRALGLAARLNSASGGAQLTIAEAQRLQAEGKTIKDHTHEAAVARVPQFQDLVVSEQRIERDADGRIVRVVRDNNKNPLNDLLNELESDEEDEDAKRRKTQREHELAQQEWDGFEDSADDDDEAENKNRNSKRKSSLVVKQLEAISRLPQPKTIRKMDVLEREQVALMIAKHGDDYDAIFWDRKVNPFQLTARQIEKKVEQYRQELAREEAQAREPTESGADGKEDSMEEDEISIDDDSDSDDR